MATDTMGARPEQRIGDTIIGSGPQDVGVRSSEVLELVPEIRFGPFVLGMVLGDVVAFLHKSYQIYDKVDLVYDETNTQSDVIIHVKATATTLRFDATQQRLRRIDFWPALGLNFEYKGRCVDAHTQQLKDVHHLFGPSRAEYNRDGSNYLLQYPGVTFGFAVPTERDDVNGAQHVDMSALETQLGSQNTVIRLTSVTVVKGLNWRVPFLLPPVTPNSGCSPHYGESVVATPGLGITFSRSERSIRFGDSCQDVISVFGAPDNVFHPDDSARIGGVMKRPGVFFNYFRHGVDVLFDPHNYRAMTFVLHANQPGHFDFCSHHRCNFACSLPSSSANEVHTEISPGTGGQFGDDCRQGEDTLIDMQPVPTTAPVMHTPFPLREFDPCAKHTMPPPLTPAASPSATTSSSSDGSATAWMDQKPRGGSTKKKKGKSKAKKGSPPSSWSVTADTTQETVVVTPESDWSAVERRVRLSEAVVFSQPPGPNGPNPFGSTKLWNHGDFIFEVMTNGRVATATLFSTRYS